MLEYLYGRKHSALNLEWGSNLVGNKNKKIKKMSGSKKEI